MKNQPRLEPLCPSCTTPSRPRPILSPGAPPAVIRHSLLRTSSGTRARWRCRTCRRTFTDRHATPYHRLRTSPSRFDRVVHLSMEGTSKAAIARAEGISSSTVSRWLDRAASHARRFVDGALRETVPEELQADEVRGAGPSRDDRHYVFCVIETSARLWLSHCVGNRTRRNCRLLLRQARMRCRLGAPRVLIVTDPFEFYREAVKKAWSMTAVHVESSKIIRSPLCVNVTETTFLPQFSVEGRRMSPRDQRIQRRNSRPPECSPRR
ncbi:MAG: helix-turn-helix domain-containing protein [Planctomycetes bacterium]|nr:helix-turn-helix domain-containing protein [Planctomycetota bacterium]